MGDEASCKRASDSNLADVAAKLPKQPESNTELFVREVLSDYEAVQQQNIATIVRQFGGPGPAYNALLQERDKYKDDELALSKFYTSLYKQCSNQDALMTFVPRHYVENLLTSLKPYAGRAVVDAFAKLARRREEEKVARITFAWTAQGLVSGITSRVWYGSY